MNNKIVLITGGNSGIGKATAIGLAKKGANITIACRNKSRGEQAVKEIKAASNNQKVSLIICDLADLESVRQCADTFKKQHHHLDVLVNNAGLIVDTYKETKQGFELQIGVNHIAHFYLTHLLMEHLLTAEKPRVVNVSSDIHYQGEIDFDRFRKDYGDYSGIPAYAQSKLANVLFTKGLAKRYPKIITNALHPGVVRTGFGNGDVKWYFKLGWKMIKPFLITPEKGAKTSIFLASSDLTVSGKYFAKSQEKRPSRYADDTDLADKLWEYSEQAINH
ncbi:MAG: SDR family oxidoreductase [Saprospiraceae bacterium]